MAEADGFTSRKKRQTENGQVSKTVNGDGNHQIFFFLVGDCKHESTHNLGERKVVSVIVGQYKECGADQDGRINTPSPKKTEDDTSEKYFFQNRPDDTAHKKEYENLPWAGRQWCINKLQRIYTGSKQYQKQNACGNAETNGPDQASH